MTGRVTSKLEKLWISVNELILRQKGEPVVHLADALIATVPDGQPSLLSSLFGLLTAHFIPLETPSGAALFPRISAWQMLMTTLFTAK